MYRQTLIEISFWQKRRHIPHQDEIIQYLGLTKLDFHGRVTASEQFKLVSGCNFMVGAHGAGLNLAIAMKTPILVEFTPGNS